MVTPKRKLFVSPESVDGLETKLTRLRVDQWASPTLRKSTHPSSMAGGEGARDLVTENPGKKVLADILRRKVIGRRRSSSTSLLENSASKEEDINHRQEGNGRKKLKEGIETRARRRRAKTETYVNPETQMCIRTALENAKRKNETVRNGSEGTNSSPARGEQMKED